MELPNDSIGISDLLAHRECPRRFSYGMRRHTGIGMQSDDETPEAGAYATDYGSGIHRVLELVEDGTSDDDALQTAWDEWGHRLEPDDLDALREDLAVYHARDAAGVRTIAVEDEYRVPLFIHDGTQIYFRFKLDRLYERLDAPGHFIHVDYKSSRHVRTEKEIHKDKQLWAYNFGIHEFWPEVERLVQLYDQLKYGQVPTSKNAPQREQMREWLIKATTSVINDEDWQSDDLLEPRKNVWCPWCPIMESCAVVRQLTEFALVEIEALAPTRKEGRKTVTDVDPDALPIYLETLEEAKTAEKVLKRFREAVHNLLKNMPAGEREQLGYSVRGRKASTWTASHLREIHEQLGPEFYELVSVTKTSLESHLSEDPETLSWALDLALESAGSPSVVKLAA